MTSTKTAKPLPPTIEVDGNAIRARRIELGHTITEFADRADMSFQYLSQLERGDRKRVTPPRFQRLVSALRMRGRESELKADAS